MSSFTQGTRVQTKGGGRRGFIANIDSEQSRALVVFSDPGPSTWHSLDNLEPERTKVLRSPAQQIVVDVMNHYPKTGPANNALREALEALQEANL